MRSTPVWGWTAALLISMVAAYMTWTRDRSKPVSDVVVLNLKKGDVTSVTLTAPNLTAELVARSKDVQWVTVTRMVEVRRATADGGTAGPLPAPQLAGTDGGTATAVDAGPPPREKQVNAFRGNASAAGTLDKFAPLQALRDLGKLEGAALEPFGLAAPKQTLTVQAKGNTHTFEVGEKPFGSSDCYLRRPSDGQVFIISGTIISDLENAPGRLMDRRLHAFKLLDVERVQVDTPQGPREMLQFKRVENDGKDAYWSDSSAPQAHNEMYQTWVQKVHRLYASKFLEPETTPKDTRPVMTLTWWAGKDKLGQLDLQVTGDEGNPTYYARSENTLAWVELSKVSAGEVARDVKGLLAGP